MFQDSASGSMASLPLGGQHGNFSHWHPPIVTIHTTIPFNERASSSTSCSPDDSSFISFRKRLLLSLPRTGNTKPRKPCPRKPTSFGRGGAGNIRGKRAADSSDRSPPLPDVTQLEQQYLLARDAWRPHQPQSSGRGGAGNISLPRPFARAIQVFVSVTKL